MTSCELCGKNIALYEAEVEGTVMKVCEECKRFGKVRGKANVRIVIEDKRKIEPEEPDYAFLPGFGGMVKNARERLKLKQEEMAKKLNVRESLLHQIESEHFQPGVELARKLEKELHIHIIEQIKNDNSGPVKANPKHDAGNTPRLNSGPLTLGDMIDIKRKKK